MSLKSFKPVTPSNRYKVWPSFDEITTSTPEKSLCRPLKKSGGRNNNGRITTRHIGGVTPHPKPPKRPSCPSTPPAFPKEAPKRAIEQP